MKEATDKSFSVAIIIPGGIGTGKNNIGVPVMERIVKLLSKDCDVTVFSLFKVNEDYAPVGFELISISHSVSVLKLFEFFRIFRQLHSRKNFRVVHGFWALPSGLLAVLMGRIFGIKSIVSILGGDAIALPQIKYGQLQRWSSRKIIVSTLKNAGEVIVLTRYLLNNLRQGGLRRDNVRIIPWGIDTTLFPYSEKVLGDPIQFLHIANLHPVKDQETLLRAFKIISDNVEAKLTIVGEGVLMPHIRALTHTLSLEQKVIFKDPLPYEQLPLVYKNAEILLHTSLSEGQSEVVTEAMSCGLLVCGTKVGLLYDLPDCCVSVPVGDHQSLALSTLKIIRDPSQLDNRRKMAYDWAKTHSILWTVDKIKECYIHE